MDVIELGSSPWGENCAQVGEDGYTKRALAECRVYARQIARHYPVPEDARLYVKSFSHEFGSYYEVVGKGPFSWLDQIEGDPLGVLENWDEEALKELENAMSTCTN